MGQQDMVFRKMASPWDIEALGWLPPQGLCTCFPSAWHSLPGSLCGFPSLRKYLAQMTSSPGNLPCPHQSVPPSTLAPSPIILLIFLPACVSIYKSNLWAHLLSVCPMECQLNEEEPYLILGGPGPRPDPEEVFSLCLAVNSLFPTGLTYCPSLTLPSSPGSGISRMHLG